jgi:hypothetical protein
LWKNTQYESDLSLSLPDLIPHFRQPGADRGIS